MHFVLFIGLFIYFCLVKKRINIAIANAKRMDESVVKQEVQQRVEKIRDEVANITQQFTSLANKTSNEAMVRNYF